MILYGSGKEEIKFEYEHVSGKGRGSGTYRSKFEGVIPHLERRYRQTESIRCPRMDRALYDGQSPAPPVTERGSSRKRWR